VPSLDYAQLNLLKSLSASSSFSVRWAGFIRPKFAHLYTFYAALSGSDERVRVWIDSALVIDMWQSLSMTVGIGTVRFGTADGFYDISLEYQQWSGHAGVVLKWATNALDAPLDVAFSGLQSTAEIINNDSLFICSDANNSQLLLVVHRNAATSCMGYSLVGDGISLSTAGFVTNFKVVSQDLYPGASSTLPVMGMGRSTNESTSIPREFSLGQFRNGSYTFNYSQTQSGEYSLTVGTAIFGGLLATYYDNTRFLKVSAFSSKVILDQSIDFEWNESNPIYSDGIMSTNNYVSVRWKGILAPSLSALYTFLIILEPENQPTEVQCNSCFDAARVSLAGKVVVDGWFVSKQRAKGSMYLKSGALYEIEVLYRHISGKSTLKLYWMSPNVRLSIIPSAAFLYIPCFLSKQSLQLSIQSDLPVFENTIVSFSLSMITAGMNAVLFIWPKDRYGNDCLGENEFGLQVFITRFGFPQLQIAVNSTSISETNALQSSFTLSNSGTAAITAALMNSGGLQATYFASDNFTTPLYCRREAVLDFSTGSTLKPISTLDLGLPFSVRWAGFVRPQFAQRYTMYAGVSSADERIRVWIESSLVINMWQNLSNIEGNGTIDFNVSNGYYKITVEYKQYSGSAGAQLSWSTGSLSKVAVPSTQIFFGQGLQLAFTMTVCPDVISIASTAQGMGLTAATSGMQAQFSILGRDRYGNAVEAINSSMFTPHLYSADNIFNLSFEVIGPGAISVKYMLQSNFWNGSFGILLFGQLHITGSPWQLHVAQADYCSTLSYAFGAGLSIGTAGLLQEIRVLARDLFGNTRIFSLDQPTPYVAAICNSSSTDISHANDFSCIRVWNLAYVTLGTWTASISMTRSGMYILNVALLSGLSDIYIDLCKFLCVPLQKIIFTQGGD
jgi:hypothetical protein